MRNIPTFSLDDVVVRYTGICAQGAYKDDPVVGYGHYSVKGHHYIYGHLTAEETEVCHWYRVKPDDIILEVITKQERMAARQTARLRRRTEHLADYGTDGLRDANYVE